MLEKNVWCHNLGVVGLHVHCTCNQAEFNNMFLSECFAVYLLCMCEH